MTMETYSPRLLLETLMGQQVKLKERKVVREGWGSGTMGFFLGSWEVGEFSLFKGQG